MNININYAGIYVFIKDHGSLTDKEILNSFGLDKSEKIDSINYEDFGKFDHYYINRSNSWTCFMDDLTYSLWDTDALRDGISYLATKFDLYYCLSGDSDESFEYEYYENQILLRKYIVADPFYNQDKLKIIENLGTPFPFEKEALKKNEAIKKVLNIGLGLSIDVISEIKQTTYYKTERAY